MRKMFAWLSFSLFAAGLLTATADAAQTRRLIFVSTQLRPIEEAQKMRNLILRGFAGEVDYITEQPQQFPVRIEAEQQGGAHAIDVVGALHDQLAAWTGTIQQKTGKRLLGFPAGPQGLMHRFFEGFLYPSYTGGVVVPFRSEAAEAMWKQFASLWKSVNPNSTSYDFMKQPLLSGDVWIGFDHIARTLDALRRKPGEFVAFPAPVGPKGSGKGDEFARLAAQCVEGASNMIKADPNVTGKQRLLHKIVAGRVRINAFPQRCELLPHRFGCLRAKRYHDTAGVRRIQEALEKAVHQPLRPRREAEQALARLLFDRTGPGGELLVAERVDVGPTRQIGQRLFVGDHDVARLHPWDVKLVRRAEFTERQQQFRDAAARQLADEVIERRQGVDPREWLQLAV